MISFHKSEINNCAQTKKRRYSETEDIDVQSNNNFNNYVSVLKDDIPLGDESNKVKKSLNPIEQKFQNLFFHFFGKLYAAPNLPRIRVQEMFNDTKDLLEEVISTVKSTFDNTLRNVLVPEENNTSIDNNLDKIIKTFDLFSTEYKLFKLLNDTGCFMTAENQTIGDTMDDKFVDGRMSKEKAAVKSKFVPQREVLQAFFSLPRVLEIVLNYMKSLSEETEVLRNFIQGRLWREKVQRYFVGKIIIPIFLHFDDFEVNNVLGSHQGV